MREAFSNAYASPISVGSLHAGPSSSMPIGTPSGADAVGADQVGPGGGRVVGPQHRGKIEFTVRALPQQEITQALFAAGADQQIRRRQARHADLRAEGLRLTHGWSPTRC